MFAEVELRIEATAEDMGVFRWGDVEPSGFKALSRWGQSGCLM